MAWHVKLVDYGQSPRAETHIASFDKEQEAIEFAQTEADKRGYERQSLHRWRPAVSNAVHVIVSRYDPKIAA